MGIAVVIEGDLLFGVGRLTSLEESNDVMREALCVLIEQEDTRETINITALNAEIARIVARQQELRTAIDAIVADLERTG